MIPLRDTIPSLRPPVALWTLIGINAAAFLLQIVAGPDRWLELTFRPGHLFGYDPTGLDAEALGLPEGAEPPGKAWAVLTAFTAMFLHGNLLHLAFNMWSLWIFGDNVEDRMGPARFTVFYLLCGVIATAGHAAADPHSMIPALGASGAIAGVMGGYFLMFPRAQVLVLVPVLFIPYVFEVPAVLFLGLWFVMQLLSGGMSLVAAEQTGGPAWWAHAGGFVGGLLLHRLFVHPEERDGGRRRIRVEQVSQRPSRQGWQSHHPYR